MVHLVDHMAHPHTYTLHNLELADDRSVQNSHAAAHKQRQKYDQGRAQVYRFLHGLLHIYRVFRADGHVHSIARTNF